MLDHAGERWSPHTVNITDTHARHRIQGASTYSRWEWVVNQPHFRRDNVAICKVGDKRMVISHTLCCIGAKLGCTHHMGRIGGSASSIWEVDILIVLISSIRKINCGAVITKSVQEMVITGRTAAI